MFPFPIVEYLDLNILSSLYPIWTESHSYCGQGDELLGGKDLTIFSIGTKCGEWTIKKYLDGAGQSQIYLADRVDLRGETVLAAIRTIKFSSLQSKEHLRKVKNAFAVEYEVLEKLNSAFIAKVFDYGINPHFWIATEFIEGESLEKRLTLGPLSVPEWNRLAKDSIRGLMHAHDRQVVHQDVKPGNIMLRADDGRAQWIDFGSASIIGENDQGYNGGSHTLAYVAPERMTREQRGDSASDIYSLGVTLYEAALGKIPWEAPKGIKSEADLWKILYESKMQMKTSFSKLTVKQLTLIKALLNPDPKKRPSATKALRMLGVSNDEIHGGTTLRSAKGLKTVKNAKDSRGALVKGGKTNPPIKKLVGLDGYMSVEKVFEEMIKLERLHAEIARKKATAAQKEADELEAKIVALKRADPLENEAEKLRSVLLSSLEKINASVHAQSKLLNALDRAPLEQRIELTKDLVREYKAAYAANTRAFKMGKEKIDRRNAELNLKEKSKILLLEKKEFKKLLNRHSFQDMGNLISYRTAFLSRPNFENAFHKTLESLLGILLEGASANDPKVVQKIGLINKKLSEVWPPSKWSMQILCMEYVFGTDFQEKHGELTGGLLTTLKQAIGIWADQNLD